MNYKLAISLALAAALPLMSVSAYAGGGKAHTHVGHVMKSWADTPNKAGFLPTAIAESKTAITHAGLAAKNLGDLKKIKMHIGHVLNAVDPSIEKKGPGLGYGVLAAAKNTSKHIGLAAASPDANDYIKLHAKHVSAAADNTVMRVAKVANLGKQILATSSTQDAAPLVKQMVILTDQLYNGEDLDGDGGVSWNKGEGGLKVSNAHAGFIMKNEGL